ncbi:MAG: hypothetical protein E7483_04875 [Ruminococcaceae bacterium]|nr:hypothetical protein [Oscillospiraceae bacterium]
MARRILLKVLNLVAIIIMVISFMFAINGGGPIVLLGLDFTGVPRFYFVISAAISAVVALMAEFYGKIAGNK